MELEPIVAVLLIDFEGHPALSDDEVLNNLRFSYLKSLIFNPLPDKTDPLNGFVRGHKFIFISDHDPYQPKINELYNMSEAEGFHEWIIIPPESKLSPHELNDLINDKGYYIHNIIAGGCNTAGCVMNSRTYSAVPWAKADFPIQIFLPMCADYQFGGATTYESQMTAICNLFNGLKETETIDTCKVVSNIWELKLDT